MNSAIEAMLSKYNPRNNDERENAIKEIIQGIALAGLSRGDFFKKAAFCGGTCLRIIYGLNRFSDDLNFALLEKDPTFQLDEYFPYLQKEFASYGINVNIELKKKSENAVVKSAFLNGNTLVLMMSFFPNSDEAKRIISNKNTKIKIEIDTDNPDGGQTEFKYKMLPAPFEVWVFDEPTLFAGKIHDIIYREYKNHVKGRDYYDYLFYIGKGIGINMSYLENKLKNTGGKLDNDEKLSINKVKEMLYTRFSTVAYESAKKDVSRFLSDKDELMFWKKELFLFTLDLLKEAKA